MALPNVISEINTIKSTYLPKSGGTLTGTLVSTTNNFSSGSSSNHMFEVFSGTTYKTGGYISLFGETYPTKPGGFELVASSTDTGQKRLTGLTDGSLTWNGNNVLTSIGGEVTGTLYTKGNIQYELRHTTASNGDTTRETATYQMLCVGLDKNGKRGGGVEISYGTGGTRSLNFTMRNRADSGWLSAGLNEYADGSAQFNILGQRAVALATNYRSGTSWYRKYADGFIEQGGRFSYTLTNSGFTKLSFVTAFTSTNYQILGSGYRSDSSPNQGFATFKDFSTSSCNVAFWDDATSNPGVINWYACGY